MFGARSCWLAVALFLLVLQGCASEETAYQLRPEQGIVLKDTPYFQQQEFHCGPASLAMLLGASGVKVQPDDLTPSIYLPGRRGSLQLELVAAGRQHGRIAYVIEPDISALTAELLAHRPVLVLQNLGFKLLPLYHYAVVIGVVPPDEIVLRSGRNKELTMNMDAFLKTWRRSGSWGMIVLEPGRLPAVPERTRYLQAVRDFEVSADAELAAAGYQAAAAIWPEDLTALFALGNNYLYRRKYPEAEAVFRKLIVHDPNHLAAFNNLAETLVRQGCFTEALTTIEHAVSISEKSDSPHKETLIQTRNEILENLDQGSRHAQDKCRVGFQ